MEFHSLSSREQSSFGCELQGNSGKRVTDTEGMRGFRQEEEERKRRLPLVVVEVVDNLRRELQSSLALSAVVIDRPQPASDSNR